MTEETTEAKKEAFTEEANGGVNIESGVEKFEQYLKPAGYAVGGLAVIFLIYFGYNQFIVKPNQEASIEKIWQAENELLDKGSYKSAILGDTLAGTYIGLKQAAADYAGYTGGKIAQYDLGIAYLNNGQYEEAIESLMKVDFSDHMISSIAYGGIGDAYSELGKVTEAIEYYTKAFRNSKNELTAPIYMLKAGASLELANEFKTATAVYQEMIEKYPDAPETKMAKKYIVFTKKGKSIYQQ